MNNDDLPCACRSTHIFSLFLCLPSAVTITSGLMVYLTFVESSRIMSSITPSEVCFNLISMELCRLGKLLSLWNGLMTNLHYTITDGLYASLVVLKLVFICLSLA